MKDKMKKEVVEKICNVYLFLGGSDFATTEKTLKEDLDVIAVMVLKELVSLIDKQLIEHNSRKKKLRIKRKRVKIIKTIFGDCEICRTYFQIKKTKKYVFLTDKKLNIHKYKRISTTVKKEIIKNSTETSYKKVAKQNDVSDNSVKNIVDSVNKKKLKHTLEEKTSKEKKKVNTLYVGADEDHISVKNKGSKMQYLVYVYDDIKKQNNRNIYQNTNYFTNKQGKPEHIWLDVVRYIENNYDYDSIEKIYIMGDGAYWIKQGLKLLPNAEFVLDKWHLAKYIKLATTPFQEEYKNYFSREIWKAIREDDFYWFEYLAIVMKENKMSDKHLYHIKEMKKYIKNNWTGIQNQQKNKISCSAEGHVSHVLSSRLSSRPMTWSEEGANTIAQLRCFFLNGGSVEDIEFGEEIIIPKEIKELFEPITLEKENIGDKIKNKEDKKDKSKTKKKSKKEQKTLPIQGSMAGTQLWFTINDILKGNGF